MNLVDRKFRNCLSEFLCLFSFQIFTRGDFIRSFLLRSLCEPLDSDPDDIANLFENLSGNFAEVVQYNKDNRESDTKNVTIDVLCDIMTDGTGKYSRKSAVSKIRNDRTVYEGPRYVKDVLFSVGSLR